MVAVGAGIYSVDRNGRNDQHRDQIAQARDCRVLLESVEINRRILAEVINAVSAPIEAPPDAPATAVAVIAAVNEQRANLLEVALEELNSLPQVRCSDVGLR